MTNAELILLYQKLFNHDIISSGKSSLDKKIMTFKQREFLTEFYNSTGHHFWINKNSGKYNVYVYAEDKPKKRKLISAVSKHNLDQAVLNYYHVTKITFEYVYHEHLQIKYSNRSTGTRDREECAWEKYFADTDFIQHPISSYTLGDIEDFVFNQMAVYKLDSKKVQKITSILYPVFHRAYAKEYRKDNPMLSFQIPRYYFTPSTEKRVKDAVLSDKDFNILESFLLNSLETENQKYSTLFAIYLDMLTGLRAGELVALKWTDIEDNYLHIARAEQKTRKRDENGKLLKGSNFIIANTKTKNSVRDIPLNKRAKKILKLLRQWQLNLGFENSEYLFINESGEHLNAPIIEQRYRRLWKKLKLSSGTGGIHELRRTFATKLALQGISIYILQKLMGHADIQTTQKYYIRVDADIENSLSFVENI